MVIASWITDFGTGSSSGGEAFHLSIGVKEFSVLVIRGEPAVVLVLEAAFEVLIFCFWRRRALANQVAMRRWENPVS